MILRSCVLILALAICSALKSVLLSRFSSLYTPEFMAHIRAFLMPPSNTGRLVYSGTAMSHFREDSPKSRGEQRRRARYDSKQKMKELQVAFGLGSSTLLELDRDGTTTISIEKALSEECDILYVDGGNTFYLQKAMNDLTFWQVALPALEASGAVYFGASAGAICAGSTIKTALFKGWDDPYANGAIDKTYIWDDVTFKGPSLSAPVFPHYDPSLHGALIEEQMAAWLPQEGPIVAIADDEAYISGTEAEPYLWCSGSAEVAQPRLFTHG